MSIYEDPKQVPILAAVLPGMVIWDAETTATAADPYPGPAAPDRGTELVWSTSGDVDTVADVVELRVERNGYPGGALAVQQRLTGATNWNGWDAPLSVGYVERADWTDGAVENASPAVCALPDGRVLVASEQAVATPLADTAEIRLVVREVGGTLTRDVPITVTTGRPACPMLAVGVDGFVRLYVWRALEPTDPDGWDVAQVDVYEASVDASTADLLDGSAWDRVVFDAIDDPPAALSLSGEWPESSSVATGGGQTMIVYLADGKVKQMYSADGYRFRHTAAAIAGGQPVAAYEAGRFVVAYVPVAALTVATRAVANAATDIATVAAVTAYDAVGGIGLGRAALTGDGAGNFWLYIAESGPTDEHALCLLSTDGGTTWGRDPVVNSIWSSSLDATGGESAPAACWWRDRVLMVIRTPDATDYAESLLLLHLGGWGNLVHDRRSFGMTSPGERTCWNEAWFPAIMLASSAFVETGTAASAAMTANGAQRVTTGLATIQWAAYGSGQIGYPYAAMAALDVASGAATVNVSSVLTAGVTTYTALVSVGSGGLTYKDGATGTTIATATISGPVQVAVYVTSTGASRAYYRAWGPGAPYEWTLLGLSLGLTSHAAGTGSATLALTISADVEIFAFSAFSATELSHGGTGVDNVRSIPLIPSGATAPGLPITGNRQYIANGVHVAGARGPGRVGDSWAIAAASPFGTEYALWDSANNSPARAWQSTGVEAEAIAWSLGDEPRYMETLWAIHWRGDAAAIWYSWHDGDAWGDETQVDGYHERTCVRSGNVLRVTSATAGPFVQRDELVGGFVVDASGKARRITGNTSGVLQQGSDTRVSCLISIVSDGTESAVSSTWRIVWPQGVTIVHPPNYAQGLRIRVGVDSDIAQTPDGAHRLKVLAGPCVVLGLPNGNDTQIEYEAQPRTFEAVNGRRRTTQAAPSRTVVNLTWQSTMDRLWQVQGSVTNDPDVIAWDDLPLYSRGEAASTLRACVERWAAAGTPVLYLPRVTVTLDPWEGAPDGAEFPQTWVDHRWGGAVVGTLDPMWTVENAGRGYEQYTEIVRLGALRITELT